jgi:hypothetical protein
MDSLLTTTAHLAARASHSTYRDQFANCTTPSDVCPINSSYYFYRMSLPANAVFLALFFISLFGFILTYAITRRATAFTVAMVCGVALEVIGYIGRILSWHNQWQQTGFLMQIVCLTIAPAFLAAGIYLCLRRIVYAFGPENSRIRPETYTRLVRLPTPSPSPHGTLNADWLGWIVHSLRSYVLAPTSCGRRNRVV